MPNRRSNLVDIEELDDFREVRNFGPSSVTRELAQAVRSLDEANELEPLIRTALADHTNTPHGPAEIADILTHRLRVFGRPALAGFILKGKAFQTVRPAHVAHQIYRLEKVDGLTHAVLAAVGNVLDDAKEQFVSTAKRLGITYSIFDTTDIARLAVAYGLLCPRDSNRLVNKKCSCGYSVERPELNVLQIEALNELRTAHGIGQQRGLVVLPTAAGKTRVAAHDASDRGAARIAYVAHSREILDVAQKEFTRLFGGDEVRLIAKRDELGAVGRVSLLTIQLISKNLEAVADLDFDYVVIDEFHHAAASTYRKFISAISPNFILGLTATPFREDRHDIFGICNNHVVVNYDLRTGINVGLLSPYHYYGCFDNIDYSRISHNGISYSIADLERVLIIPSRNSAIVKKWRDLALNKATLAFCCSHKHAQRMADSFNESGITAEYYLGTTKRSERLRLLDRFRLGEIKVLCVVDVLNEGVDIPFVECLLFLRPTESKRIFFQQMGRGLRKYAGKTQCTVIDFIGNFRNAYRILDYQSLLYSECDDSYINMHDASTAKDILNLPLGCEVLFDDKILDVFNEQINDPAKATRFNIARILQYNYLRLGRKLKRRPCARDIDRYSILNVELYRMVFGSWKKFEKMQIENRGSGNFPKIPSNSTQRKL